MKELEATIPKAKGVIYQSVQECVTQLVAENRVQTERIGVFQLFWHFSATAGNALGAEADALKVSLARAEERKAAGEATLAARETAAASAAAEDADERAALQQQLATLTAERAALQARLANVSDCDPVVYRELQRGAAAARDLANTWIDNILSLEAYAGRRMGMPRAEFRRKFAVPTELDFIIDVPPAVPTAVVALPLMPAPAAGTNIGGWRVPAPAPAGAAVPPPPAAAPDTAQCGGSGRASRNAP
eukprot:CAMPEP_0174860332 /NCGR_PEP_ID=MMETSP1114-20130205/48895_1 /TAXON_ID=312471 /ORGANISM="Neobodo designis, Strain CCAP 1951/1" /LENGTH=246 /DNA_ID=CAMNT_0016095307 /DNA_START=8 /DNA_END=744 /DNA_ORIENTATION=-